METARPTKLNDDVMKRIGEGIKIGMPYEQAAVLGGVSYDSFNKWMKRGDEAKKGDEIYVKFYNYIKESEAAGIQKLLDNIQAAGADSKTWQANSWILERRYPERFGRKLDVKQSGSIDIAVKIVDSDD